MTPNIQEQVHAALNQSDLRKLFIEVLGWDNTSGGTVTYQDPDTGVTLRAVPIAQKRGIPAYVCDSIPTSNAIAGIERLAGARTVERLMIFTDGSTQLWRWPETRRSGGTRYITHRHAVGSDHPDLVQRLAAITFTMAEEPTLTVLTVRQRLQASFNADRVTARFYNEFQERQQSLRDSIEGIPDDSDTSWYSSLLLNRLMFIYFMQRKGFLNGDLNYLRTSLTAIQELKGQDQFYEYYRDFLIPLFHFGLGAEDVNPEDPAIQALMGDVPYINGGIFSMHMLEKQYDIHVPDSSFVEIFDFFDRFRWHLDERPTGNPEEINPEVLGYIFERYVNRSETGGDSEGAYYTKEDVTGYMAGMTVSPLFIDRMFEMTSKSPWALLAENPVTYIPTGLRYGLTDPVPEEVEAADRYEAGVLEEVGTANASLPGERWREVLDRREYVEWLNAYLTSGAVEDTDLALTLNLDLQALAVDWLTSLTTPEDVATAYSLLIGLRVLDPTCGSGAFLFAVLDVLDELYEAVLGRAEELVGSGIDTGDQSLERILHEVQRHPSRPFFVLKTIVLSNLYGVDLVEEATEIARLRLFLALVSRLGRREELEPLPDLDMNILPGNALVGSATVEDIAAHFGADLLASASVPSIVKEAESTAQVYRQFVNAQREAKSWRQIDRLKTQVQDRRGALREQLDGLHSPKGSGDRGYEEWKRTHKPFHWFIEFPEVMLSGGFDVVCGNPPYVKRSTRDYTFSGFATDEAKDIFAPCMERAASVLRPSGRLALIVPISFQFSADYNTAREVMTRLVPTRLCSTYSRNPSALFTAGLGVRSTILIGHRNTTLSVATTSLRRWYEDARPYLFDTARYTAITPTTVDAPWPRTGDPDIARLYSALTALRGTLADATHRRGQFTLGFKQTALYYMSVFIDDPPAWMPDGRRTPQTKIGYLKFQTEDLRDIAFCLLSGRLATWWWGATGDDFDVTSGLLGSFPVAPASVDGAWPELRELARHLRSEQPNHPIVTRYAGKEMGNYDMLRCRHITDQADRLVLDALGLGELWPAVLLADDRLNKQTGERPGTEREWPFPWEPGQ